MGLRFIRIAVVYLVVGATLGLGMGMAQRFTLAPVHAHIVLLGWASLALAGIVYHLYPAAGETRLARIHFWLHNLGLPCFMVALALMLLGREWILPFLAGSATTVLVGLFVFAANVFLNIRPASGAA